MATQSIPLCMLFSILGGCLNVLATALLAYIDDQKKRGNEWSKTAQNCALVGNLFLQAANSAANVVASIFGPVSIVIPTIVASQLLFNMIMFGAILKLEKFSKDMRVATYVVTTAAVLLPTVGPNVQEDQDILSLLQTPHSLAWSIALVATMFLSGGFLVYINTGRGKLSEETQGRYGFVLNLFAQATAGVIGTTLSKMLVLVDGDVMALALIIGLWGCTAVTQTYSIVKQATTVQQATFVPLLTALNILINAATGLIIWEDWLVVKSWPGYVSVMALLVLGNYLLSSFDVLEWVGKQSSTQDDVENSKEMQDDTDSETDSYSDLEGQIGTA